AAVFVNPLCALRFAFESFAARADGRVEWGAFYRFRRACQGFRRLANARRETQNPNGNNDLPHSPPPATYARRWQRMRTLRISMTPDKTFG
ncbi:hypothetical protein, partial [Halomonas sp. WWR20]